MRNSLLLTFACLVATIHASPTCVLRHNSTVLSGTRKLDCEVANCWVEISPSASNGTVLQISAYSSEIIYVMTYFIDGQKKMKTLKGATDNNETFIAGPGEGFLFRRTHGNCNSSMLPEYEFFRIPAESSVCDPFDVHVGYKVVKIQKRKYSNVVDNCPYRLEQLHTDKIGNETLYILSTDNITLQAMYLKDDLETRNGSIIIVPNWESVEFIVDHKHIQKYEGVGVPPIFAVSTNRSCSCNMVTKSTNESVTIQSPGYPDFLCPAMSCKFKVSFPPVTVQGTKVERKLVSINAKSWKGVSLHLKSKTMEKTFDELIFTSLQTKFLIDESDLEITFITSQDLHVGEEGHFKMGIKQIVQGKECKCTLFNQKNHIDDFKNRVTIPAHCDFLFCDWTIIPGVSNLGKQIQIKMENAQDGDEVTVWNREISERYDSNQLMTSRALYISEGIEESHLFFSRTSRGSNSTLIIVIKNVPTTVCDVSETVFVNTVPIVVTSSHYPLPYTAGQCGYYFDSFLKNYHIEVEITDLELEANHDYLNLYDGDAMKSSMKIASLTGNQKNLRFSSSGGSMTAAFSSDNEHFKRGFHLIVVAMPNKEPADTARTISIEDNDESIEMVNSDEEWNEEDMGFRYGKDLDTDSVPNRKSFLNNNIQIFECFLIVAAVAGIATVIRYGLSILKKNASRPNTAISFGNANVSYHSDENDAVVTIENPNQ
uniref:CUB domain-containing protein n=1 Tax=Caenorhabditis tropicalis TaxID=1561998 RepID=A0A1I7T0S8_9PELO